MTEPEITARPVLGIVGDWEEATQAVADLVAELQAGLDARDADLFNRHFAADVVWGSPYGATVYGYDQLHPVHQRLQAQGAGGPSSRYEVVHVAAPADDVVIAHVRRVAVDADGGPADPPAFSEMALYVLIRREGEWWLAAGQNTLIGGGPPAS